MDVSAFDRGAIARGASIIGSIGPDNPKIKLYRSVSQNRHNRYAFARRGGDRLARPHNRYSPPNRYALANDSTFLRRQLNLALAELKTAINVEFRSTVLNSLHTACTA
jgi:hypothetical protein